MRKSIFTLAPVVAALLAGSGVAQAASNAQMTITANVVAATCDVSLSNASLDLGNYSKSAFTTVATPVTASVKTFTVGLSNCETPAKAGDKASLIVTGQTLGGTRTYLTALAPTLASCSVKQPHQQSISPMARNWR